MTRRSSAAFLGLILTGLCSAQSAAPQQSATVSGTVTSATGELLGHVRCGARACHRLSWYTYRNGNFERIYRDRRERKIFVHRCRPGRYFLTAERIGFLDTPYFEVKLDPGQNKSGIVLEMTPQGIIAGRVVDDANEPLAGAEVAVGPDLRKGGTPPRLVYQAFKGTTDADGGFSIGGFPPGRYILTVTPPLALALPVKPQNPLDPIEAYIKSYYPDGTDFASAAAIEIGPGSQVRGLEVQIRRVPVFKISGKVINSATGGSGPAEIINLIYAGSATPGQPARSTAIVSGEFSFENVPLGNYILETRALEEPGPQPPLIGWQLLSVSNSDLEGLVVEMKPSIELRGRVLVEGAPISSLPQITLTPIEGLNYLASPTVDANGTFSLKGVEPTAYRLTLGVLRAPLFVKSIRFNGQDVHGNLNFSPAASASLDIVIAHGTASLSGVVKNSGVAVGPGIPVLVARDGGGFFGAKTDERGSFSMTNLPPGEYRIIAMETMARDSPALLLKIATAVMVDDAASAAVEIPLSSTEDVRAARIALSREQ